MSSEPKHDGSSGGRRVAAVVAALGLVAVVAWILTSLSPSVLYEGASEFGALRVVEEPGGLRALYMGEGRARQTALDPDEPDRLVLEYAKVADVGLALAPPEARILYVGLGGGAMPMHARAVRPTATIDVVEIDPAVVALAREYFGFATDSRLAVHVGDGRAFIEEALPASYDLIVLDAFSDDEIPRALATRQFLEAVDLALAPMGIVVSNLWSSSPDYGAMVATYQAVFDQVHLVRVPGHDQRILVAGPDGRRLHGRAMLEAATELMATADLDFDLADLVAEGYEPAPPAGGAVLEDGGG